VNLNILGGSWTWVSEDGGVDRDRAGLSAPASGVYNTKSPGLHTVDGPGSVAFSITD